MVAIGVLLGVMVLFAVLLIAKVLWRPYSRTEQAEGLRLEQKARDEVRNNRSQYGSHFVHSAIVPPRADGRR
ncbi:hypothetical protein G3I42_12460 [Streptomyces sp. SID11385]|nr:hypothetical protein [Streptomyces sp. SID11385]NEA40076.1 hypothetical protein [Streptomyces sp. SID11385]